MDDVQAAIARVREGQIDAFGRIVDAYQRQVWQIVAFAMQDIATTEDLVQQVFVNAFLKIDQYGAGNDFGAWLRAIARNQVREELRRRGRQSRRLEVYRQHLEARLDMQDVDYEESLRQALDACKENLGPAAAQALQLRYEERWSFDAIAEALGRTLAATRQLLQRVRLTLRGCIEQRMTQS